MTNENSTQNFTLLGVNETKMRAAYNQGGALRLNDSKGATMATYLKDSDISGLRDLDLIGGLTFDTILNVANQHNGQLELTELN